MERAKRTRTHDQERELPEGNSQLVVATVDPSDTPLSDVVVTLRGPRTRHQAVTEADGEVVFQGIPAGSYKLRLAPPQGPEFVSAGQVRVEAHENRRIVLRIADFDQSIHGRILDRAGIPIPEIEVTASRFFFRAVESAIRPADQSSQRAVSDVDGSFEIHGVEEAEYEVRTVATDLYPTVKKIVRAGTDPVDIVLNERHVLRVFGRVSAQDGRRLQGVLIRSLGKGGGETKTVQHGLYSLEFEQASEEVQILRYQHEGYQEAVVQLRREEIGDATEWELDVVLEPAGLAAPVLGVITTNDNAAAGGQTVHLQSPSLAVRLQALSDKEGRFSFPEVRVGEDYRLWVYPKEHFKDFVLHPVSVPPDGIEIGVTLEPLGTGTIVGQIVDGDGNAVPRLSLWLHSTKAVSRPLEVAGDDSGYFEVENVPEGTLTMQTRTSPRFTVSGVALASGEEKQLRLLVDTGTHEVSGVVTKSAGRPFGAAKVELYWTHSESEFRSTSYRKTLSDEDGHFTFTGVGKGPHKVKVTAGGHDTVQIVVDVGSGALLSPIQMRPAKKVTRGNDRVDR